ncbi:hypothetical protein IWW48_000919 [Coemansia sp. RSA 1200]|nr:hypothetical protein IWW48_000919 [Coemansia sp. RSA 1200]
MIPSLSLFLGRSSQKQHSGLLSGSTVKPAPHISFSLLFEDIRTRDRGLAASSQASPANKSTATSRRQPTNRNSSNKMDEDPNANRTFAIVKPDALTPFKYQQIDALIKLNEFSIARQKLVWLTEELADALFPDKASDADRQEWLDYITSAPSLALELEKVDAPLFWQLTMGAEDPSETAGSDTDSIRGILAVDHIRNAVDGSQEPEDAANHLALIFSDKVPSLSYDNFLMERADDAHETLAIIKPDVADSEAQVLQITRRITARGYTIKDRVEITLSRAQAQAFYAEHQDKPFFDSLVDFMTSGPVIALSLDGDDVIRGWRMMAGQTDPDEARAQTPQSIRALFGSKCPRNAVHGSDSAESAERELAFFFSPRIQPEKEIPSAKEEPSPVHAEEIVTQDDDVSTQMGEDISAIVGGDNTEADTEAGISRPLSGEKKKKKQKKRRNKRKQTVSSNSAGLAADPSSTRDATNASDESDEDKSPSPTQQSSAQVQAGSDHTSVEKVSAEEVDEMEAELPANEVGTASEIVIQSDAPSNSINNKDSNNAVESSVMELAVPSDPTNERTFGLIKPDAYPRYRKQLISHIIEKGLIVVAQEEVVLTRDAAERIYDGIKTFPVFPRVIDFVTSGPVLALVLEGANAVSVWRGLVGPSHPRTARFEDCNSMRAKYGHDGQKNAVHASKDLEEARSSIKTVFYDLLGGRFTTLQAGDDPLNVVPSAEKDEQISIGNKDPEALESGKTSDNSADQPAEPQTGSVSEKSSDQGIEKPVNEINVETSEDAPGAADSLQEETSVVDTGATPLVENMDNGSVDGTKPTVAAIATANVESNGDVSTNEDENSTEKTNLKDERSVSSTASLADSPQSKSTSVSEKQSSFGSRLASSPFLKADRQVTQDQSATKRVGKIKSPFLGSERAEPVDSSPPSSVPKSIRSSPQTSLATVNSEAAHDTKNAPAVAERKEKEEKTDATAKSDGNTDDAPDCANIVGLNIVESSVPSGKTEEPVCEDDSKCDGKTDKDLEKQSSTSTTDESLKETDAQPQNQPRSNGAVDEKPKPPQTNEPAQSTAKPVPARPVQRTQPATSTVQRAAHKTSTQGSSDTAPAASRGLALRRTALGQAAAKAKATSTTTTSTTTRPARAAASALGNEAKLSAGSARKLPPPSQPVPVASAKTSGSTSPSSSSYVKPSATAPARPRVVARSVSVKMPVSSRQPPTAARTCVTPGDAGSKKGIENSTSNGPPPRRAASITRAPAQTSKTLVVAARPRVAPSSTAASVTATKSAAVSSTPAARTPGASLSTPRRAIAQESTAASSTTPAVSRSRAAPAQPQTASSAVSSRTSTPRPMLTRPTAPAVSVASTASSRARAAKAAEARAAEAKAVQTRTSNSERTAAGVRQAPALAHRVSRTSTTTTARPVAKTLSSTGSFARRTAASSARAAIPAATSTTAATTAEAKAGKPLKAVKDDPKDYPVLDETPQAGIEKEPEVEDVVTPEANERVVVAQSSN